MPSHLDKYVQYIKNTGLIPLRVSHFDEDWEPIGPQVRRDLVSAKMIKQHGGQIYLPGDVSLHRVMPDVAYLAHDHYADETNEERLRRTLEMIIEDIKFKKKLGLLGSEFDAYIKLGEQTLRGIKP